MTVIEVRGRGGQLLERLRLRDGPIRIGRALDNDVVLDDPHACPQHARLSPTPEGWRFEDLDSLNGLRHEGRRARDGLLRSGDELRIGHLHVRVFAEDHVVEPTVRLGGAESRLAALGRPQIWVGLLALALVLVALDQYWSTTEEFDPLSLATPLATEVALFVTIAAFWALLGRILRHQACFSIHMAIWIGVSLASQATGFLEGVLAYNLSAPGFETALDALTSTALLALMAWCSLTVATTLTGGRRAGAALAVAGSLLGLGLLAEMEFDRGFNPHPEYSGRVEGPRLLLRSPEADALLFEALPELFDEADARRDEEAEEEREADEANVAEAAQPSSR